MPLNLKKQCWKVSSQRKYQKLEGRGKDKNQKAELTSVTARVSFNQRPEDKQKPETKGDETENQAAETDSGGKQDAHIKQYEEDIKNSNN